jgi:undecaprenyl-diphosphatase
MENRPSLQRAAAWWGVISADIAAFRAYSVGSAGRWWNRVSAWFRFVHHRRPDTRFPVFPGSLRAAEILLVLGSTIIALVLFADPLFLSMLEDRSPVTLAIFEAVTRLGESSWILYAAGGVLLAISLVPPDGMARSQRMKVHDWLLVVYFLFTSVAFSGLVTSLFKNLIGRARPQFTPAGDVWHMQPFRDNYDFASFPSGHATTAGAVAMALMLLAPRYRVFFLFLGLWIAISRPVLGVHFPSDILAGLAVGAGFTYLYARSFARKRLLFSFRSDGSLQVNPRLADFARVRL